MADENDTNRSKEYTVVETKRHKPCLIFRGYRYVQDKIQNRTIYWRCEDRTHCNGRAHQLVSNGSTPVLTIKHNHQPNIDDVMSNDTVIHDAQHRKRKSNLKVPCYQQNDMDDLLLSSTSSTMTSPIKLENHQNRQHHLQQHGAMVKNLHLSEVITTAAATNAHHYNGIGMNRHHIVDPIEMTKLLSNITTTTPPSNTLPKTLPPPSNMDCMSRLNHFSWEEIEGRYLPVIFRNENDSLQRYTSKMYVENTLFQSESWQRYAILARSLPPLISFPYTENELKLFRLIIEWHLASFHFKTILPSDCLIRFDDLLDFYGALRKLRDSVTATSFNRPLPPPPIPPTLHMAPPKPRIPPTQSPSTSSNNLSQSFELPTMNGNSSLKSQAHLPPRHSSSGKLYPPPSVHPSHSSHYMLPQNADLIPPFPNPQAPPYNFNSMPLKPNVPVLPTSSNQWNETLSKTNDKIRPPISRPPMPINNPLPRQEQIIRDKQTPSQKLPQPSADNHNLSRETKECGWVQINNVFVPYIVKLKLRESELEKCTTRQPPPQLQREFFVPYEILIKCHIFSDSDFAFKKFLIKATQQDFDIFNSLISNINIFDEKVPEKTLLVNLYHVMIGLQKVLYVKLLTTKQPRTQVNKYHAEVLTHKGGTLLMHENKLVPYILQNNRFYVPLAYAFHSLPHIIQQAKRGARAPRQYELDYLNLLFLYFSIDSPPLTSDTLLVDAFSVKSPDIQPPIHFRTLAEHQQHGRNKLLGTLMRLTQVNSKVPNKSHPTATKASVLTNNTSTHKSNKCPPANVVVNPLIHHPSFYGLSSNGSSIKQTPPQPPSSHANRSKTPPTLPTASSSSAVANPLLLRSTIDPELATKKASKQSQVKTIKYGNQLLNVILKASDQSINESKISIKQIFEQFSFNVNYDKFIQWCQVNLLLPLIKLDDEVKKILNIHNDDYYVDYRHLDRCIELLNDLKRGTISMTLLPSSNIDSQQQQTTSNKSQLAGAKKRKTTIPTTRHILPPQQSSSPSSSMITRNESNPPSQDNGYLSPDLPLAEESVTSTTNNSMINHDDTSNNNTNDKNNESSGDDGHDDDTMPVVAAVEEEQPIQEFNISDTNTSLLIIDSNECDDGKIQLDDTLPSCSSGYESAAPLTNADINMVHHTSSDDEETSSTTRSREHSSSCQSEQSHAPILSTVSTNITFDLNDHEKNDSTPVISNQKSYVRQRDKYGKFCARSRSPTPRSLKRKRSYDDTSPASGTITSDQIEQHLRTLLPSPNEQRRTRTRSIKTPTRLVEEIASNNTIKSTEPDMNVFDIHSFSSSPSTPTTSTDTSNKINNSNEPMINHQPCTYNVTISTKPNKLGLTIKKIIQR